MDIRAIVSLIVIILVYIGRPLMNVKVNLFYQDDGKGNVNAFGNFMSITVCHGSTNRSGVVQDQAYDDPANSSVVSQTPYAYEVCEDIQPDVPFVLVLGANYLIILLGCIHVFLSAVWLRKSTNMDAVSLAKHAALGCFIELLMILCYILFASMVGKAGDFLYPILRRTFLSWPSLPDVVFTLMVCTLIISVRKLLWKNEDAEHDKNIKPLIKA